MDDNEFNARVEGNKIVANVIRGYQRQLAEAQAEVARLQTERNGAREATRVARAAEEAERAKRNSGEIVILAARRVMSEPSRDNLTALVAAIKDYDKAMEGR